MSLILPNKMILEHGKDALFMDYKISGKGEPLVFLPGLGLDSGVFDEIVCLLKDNYTCIQINNNKFIKRDVLSDLKTVEYDTVKAMANNVAQLVSKLKIKSATFVGHSLGGFIAMHLAMQCPALVKKLFLISTSNTGNQIKNGMTKTATKAFLNKKGSIQSILQETLSVSVGEYFKIHHAAKFKQLIAQRLEYIRSVSDYAKTYIRQQRAVQSFDLDNCHQTIQCNCTIMHGNKDQIISLNKARELKTNIKGSVLFVLNNAGHLPMIENPLRVAQIIENTIEKHKQSD